jgi:ketosteroid isomerase-like protein
MKYAAMLTLITSLLVACGQPIANDAASPVPKTQALNVQQAKTIIAARIQASNSQDFAKWQSFHSSNACRTAPELPGELCGSDKMRVAIEELVKAFPDYQLALVDIVGSGNRYMAKIHAKGTFTAPIQIGDGSIVPPTGKAFEQDWIANITFDQDGKITRFEEFHDQLDVYYQLGVMKP